MNKKIIAGIAAVALLVGVYVFPINTQDTQLSAAQADYFLKLDDVDGESKTKGHEGDIEILAWSWGVSNQSSAHVGGGLGSGKVNYQDISVTKIVDSTSPTLLRMCTNGLQIKKATITSGGLTLMFTDLACTSFKQSASNGQTPTDQVSFSYSKIEMK